MNRSELLAGRCEIAVVTVEGGQPSAPVPSGAYHSSLTPGDTYNPPPQPGVYVICTLGREMTSVHLLPDTEPVEALVHLANGLQDWAIELSHGQALPACPGHAHPLLVREIDGAAAWCCPKRPAQPVYPVA